MPARQVVNDTALAEGQKVKDGARGFADQRISSGHVGSDIVFGNRQQDAVRIVSDPALEDTMLRVGCVSSHPAIVMQLDDQVKVPRCLEDGVLHLVEAGGLIGRSEK